LISVTSITFFSAAVVGWRLQKVGRVNCLFVGYLDKKDREYNRLVCIV